MSESSGFPASGAVGVASVLPVTDNFDLTAAAAAAAAAVAACFSASRFSWYLRWLVRLLFHLKRLVHESYWHAYGQSPVWVRMWVCRLYVRANERLHLGTWHMWVVAPLPADRFRRAADAVAAGVNADGCSVPKVDEPGDGLMVERGLRALVTPPAGRRGRRRGGVGGEVAAS